MMILSKRPGVTGASRSLMLIATLSLGLQGCIWVEDTTDLRAFVAQKAAQPGGKIEPLPEFKPYQSFVYEGASLRDPFVPLVQIIEEVAQTPEGATELKPDEERVKEYLEEFPVDQLAMVGTITALEDGHLIALVKDTRGEVHQVIPGNYMGLDYGEVVAIEERSITLEEIVSNGRGGWMKRPRTVTLPELE